MWRQLPGRAQNTACVFHIVLLTMAFSCQQGGRHQAGCKPVGFHCIVLCLVQFALCTQIAGLGQGKNRIAALVHIFWQRPMFQLGGQGRPDPVPIFLARLQLEQDILGFAMPRLECKSMFGQLQRHFCVPILQMLLQQTVGANKTGFGVF